MSKRENPHFVHVMSPENTCDTNIKKNPLPSFLWPEPKIFISLPYSNVMLANPVASKPSVTIRKKLRQN